MRRAPLLEDTMYMFTPQRDRGGPPLAYPHACVMAGARDHAPPYPPGVCDWAGGREF